MVRRRLGPPLACEGPRCTIDEPPPALGRGTAEDPRLVVEAWLAVPAEAGHRVLLLRRAPSHGGFWQGVSGSVESVDASLRAAALREIREETGLAADLVFDLERWWTFSGYDGTVYRKRTLGALLPEGTAPAGVVLTEEHDAVELLTFDEARSRVRWTPNVEELLSLEHRLRGDRQSAR